jgi:two-component system, cell cycle sensor histidine kinase and response regulator CckA
LAQTEFQSDPQGEVPTLKGPDSVKNSAAESPPIPGAPAGPDRPDYHSQAERDSEVNKELRRLNRALRALSASNQALAQATSEQELLHQICDVIVRLGKYRLAWIGYALRDEEKTLRPMAIAGDDDGYVAQALVTWSDAPAGRGAMGTAIRENRWCVIADIQTDPRFEPWREWGRRMGYRALLALPLRVAGLPFGALAIYAQLPGSFENSEIKLLEEIADNLAYGIAAVRARDESKRAEEALLEAEAKYRQLVEQVPAISYVAEAGAQGRFHYLSPQVKNVLGYRAEDCVQDPLFWWNHLNPEDHPTAMLEDQWEPGRPLQMEYRMRRQDGQEVWLRDEALVFIDPETAKRMTRGLLIDITDRKRADEARRDSEERYRVFVAQSAEGIYRTEHDPPVPAHLPVAEQIALSLKSGYIAECNDAMAKMYGFSEAKELLGKKLSEFLIADDPVTREFMATYIQSGYRITDWESHERDAHGRVKIFRNTMMGIVEEGKLVRNWGIQRDVTERMHLEQQLRNAQQLEAIGRLAGGVAHDFNNILSIITGHSELLLRTVPLEERVRNGLEQIRRAAERAALLTHQLLAFSRKQVLQPKVLDLNEAVVAVQQMLARVIGEDIALVANLDPSLLLVKADPGQVEQVLMNLAINARDAMPQGGKLTMTTSNLEVAAEQGRDYDLAPGRYAMLQVADNGEGMDATTLPHIFEPFFTTKPIGKGTGLGLSTVYGIVKQSGGSVQVESEPGRGTVFRICLPAQDGVSQQRQERGGERIGGGSETILIAEDEADLRDLTRIFLQEYGYFVITASSAEQAIHIADEISGPIHLLLTDVIMPGMSGRQLAEHIQCKRPQTKIVYMTGYTEDMVMPHKVLEPGVLLLQKPFTRADLALKVRSTLDGPGTRD